MADLTTYTVRLGRPTPLICDPFGSAEGVIVFTFGVECQQVLSCATDQRVVRSDEMCLIDASDNALFSAQYKALPSKVNGSLVYDSVLTRKPVYSNDYGACSTGSTSSPVSSDFFDS